MDDPPELQVRFHEEREDGSGLVTVSLPGQETSCLACQGTGQTIHPDFDYYPAPTIVAQFAIGDCLHCAATGRVIVPHMEEFEDWQFAAWFAACENKTLTAIERKYWIEGIFRHARPDPKPKDRDHLESQWSSHSPS